MRGAVQSGDESKRGEESSRVESGLSLSSREEDKRCLGAGGWWSGVEWRRQAGQAGRQAGLGGMVDRLWVIGIGKW